MRSRRDKTLRLVGFDEAVADSTGGQYKVLRRDYLPKGKLPVIDQGQSLIAGYTDDMSVAYSGDLPVVLFGDHTLIFKYIDFPFALGADGVKVLCIRKPFLPKYLYYFWQSCNISSRGYSRHFKFVKEIPVPLIPDLEQRRIVEILDQADALGKKRAEAAAKAARILPALFYKMFGDPATNPKGWPTTNLDEVADIGTQLVDPNDPKFLDLPHIGGEQIEKDTGRILSPKLVRDSDLRSGKFHFTSDHILYSKIRPYLNKVAYPRFDGVCSADIYPIRPKDSRVSQWYLIGLLRTSAFLAYARIHSERLRMAKLNREQLGAFNTPLPSSTALETFENQANQIELLEKARIEQADRITILFNALLNRAFTGDLTAKWREANMKELLAEMESQARYLNDGEPSHS